MNLALFDFDGTITNKDIFTDFIYSATERKRLILGLIILMPVIICFKMKILSSSKTREIIAGYAFKGRTLADVQSVGSRYSDDKIARYVRPEALERLQWHKSRGDKIVVVSASLDVYLKQWCDKNRLDLICTSFEIYNGFISGKYQNGDCSGKEKAARVLQRYNIRDYKVIYAYGDTSEDKELLDLAHIKYFRWQLKDSISS